MRRLQEEIQKQATDSDHDVTAITLALTAGFQHTKATMALQVRLGPLCIEYTYATETQVMTKRRFCYCFP